jgi:Tol biopolymer transport system component
MKKPLSIVLFIIAILLNSCASFRVPSLGGESAQNDYLVYLIDEYQKPQQVVFYDPISNIHTQILYDWEINAFSLSTNNRLAFSSLRDGRKEMYVLDYPLAENTPMEITPAPLSENQPISWSPDGHYLLFTSNQGDNNKLMLWDGKNFSEIYYYHAAVDEVTWSLNGQLAFTDFYTFVFPQDYDGDSSEIFVWDGNTTVSVSQNLSGDDRYPAWSKDGKLAFLSERNERYNIFVWDGITKNNGVPDINTFINVAPHMTHSYFGLTWTNSGTLAFSAIGESDSHAQIYEWDGYDIKNISQNPLSDNGAQSWSNDGYWSFTTLFSNHQNFHVRDNANNTVLITDGYYAPVWSPNGLLMFCNNDSSGWLLSIWNGAKIIEVTRGSFIAAKWQNGGTVFCSFA